MGGECTQILLDALLIANVGKYIVKNSQPGSLKCRDMESSLSHPGKDSAGT